MTTELVVSKRLSAIGRRLAAEHKAADQSFHDSLDHARRAGELLAEAKGLLKHGEWIPWLAANFEGSETTARGYMRVAEHWPEVEANRQRLPVLNLQGTLKLLSKPRPALPAAALQVDDHSADAGTVVDDPNPPETPDSPPDAPTSLQSVPADEQGLDDDQDPGERLAGTSVAGEPILEVDSIPCTKAFADIRERISRCLEQIKIKHPKATGVEVRTAFAMAVEGIYG